MDDSRQVITRKVILRKDIGVHDPQRTFTVKQQKPLQTSGNEQMPVTKSISVEERNI